MSDDDEHEQDVLDDFVVLQGSDLVMTLGRHLFSRHQDVAQLSKILESSATGISDIQSLQRQLFVLYHREQWRTEQEDATLESLFRSPLMRIRQLTFSSRLINDFVQPALKDIMNARKAYLTSQKRSGSTSLSTSSYSSASFLTNYQGSSAAIGAAFTSLSPLIHRLCYRHASLRSLFFNESFTFFRPPLPLSALSGSKSNPHLASSASTTSISSQTTTASSATSTTSIYGNNSADRMSIPELKQIRTALQSTGATIKSRLIDLLTSVTALTEALTPVENAAAEQSEFADQPVQKSSSIEAAALKMLQRESASAFSAFGLSSTPLPASVSTPSSSLNRQNSLSSLTSSSSRSSSASRTRGAAGAAGSAYSRTPSSSNQNSARSKKDAGLFSAYERDEPVRKAPSRSASPSPDLLSATTTKVVDAEATAWVLELTQMQHLLFVLIAFCKHTHIHTSSVDKNGKRIAGRVNAYSLLLDVVDCSRAELTQLIAALSVRGVDQHHLSQTHVTKLPALRKHHCAVVVQKNVRMWLARRKAKQVREGRKLLEKHARDRLKQQQRRAAAEKLQAAFRKYLEWRAKIEAKIVEITKKNAARRIQRWFRRARRVKKATRLYFQTCKKKVLRRAQVEKTNYWPLITQAKTTTRDLERRAGGGGGDTQAGERWRRWRAALVVQKFVRRFLAQRYAEKRRAQVVIIQKLIRGYLARRKAKFLRAYLPLRLRRVEKAKWRLQSQRISLSMSSDVTIAEFHAHAQAEFEAQQQQQAYEHMTIERQWHLFETSTTRTTLEKPLPDYWVPQLNRRVNQTYYFNLKTGQISEEHPHMKFVRLNLRVERQKVDAQLQKSMEAHQSMIERVRGNELAQRRRIERTLLIALDRQFRAAQGSAITHQ